MNRNICYVLVILVSISLMQTGCDVVSDVSKGSGLTTNNTNSSTGTGDSNTVTVNGKIEYADKEYGLDGFTGKTSSKAVRYAKVEIIDSITYKTVASGVTDSKGTYSITFTFNSKDVTSVYLRVIAKTAATNAPPIEVQNLSGALYSASSQDFTPYGGGSITKDISIRTTDAAAGAFNIMDVYTVSGEFIYSLGGENPPLIKAYWETGNLYGTWYCPDSEIAVECPQGGGVYIKGGGWVSINNYDYDTDEYDDDVLWHEYGHFIASKFSKDDSPGGIHYLSSNDLDLRLSWSEGWGNFFPAAVKSWLNSTNSSLLSTVPGDDMLSRYVDTTNDPKDEDGIYISINIANPGTAKDGSDPFIYSSSEMAVAKVLWNINNAFGMSSIWNVFYSYLPTVTTPTVNLEEFWDGWLSIRKPSGEEITTLNGIYRERLIFYQEDEYESDETAGIGKIHYLYRTDGKADEDIMAFYATAGTTYTIETYDLKNGADTYLTLLNTDGTAVLDKNDNLDGISYSNCDDWGDCPANGVSENGVFPLSSKITFRPSFSGTYYISVKTSPDKPESAGRYGTYTLKITGQ